jgi:Tol biopolymer transport system component
LIAAENWTLNDKSNIWRFDRNGGNARRLTNGKQDMSPSFTPDGKWVVYSSLQNEKSILMKVPSAGGEIVKLTSYSADRPSVSPDGKWIACTYIAHPGQPLSLAVVPIDGGPPATVYRLPETAFIPHLDWTPDGRAITFINNVNGAGNIWQQALAGGAPEQVTHFVSGKIFNFQWSRDGRLAIARGTETVDAVLIENFRNTSR